MSEPVHVFFGLTYSNYLVLPRAVLQSMPDEWQQRFIDCIAEMDAAFPDLEWPKGGYDVRALAREPERIEEQWGPDDECTEERWETPVEAGIITDPIPHYNRGRTRLPRSEAA